MSPPASRSGLTGVWLAGALLALLAFRFWFAAALPMTGDEAYFVLWGERPAGGYYDHPPMVGWWLVALLQLGRAEWWLRLPALLLPFVLAWGAWFMLRAQGEARARYAALLVLLQPVDVWNVLITTDTPVILFSFLSVLAYVTGARRASSGWHVAAGLLLTAAFLGKYFAALLGFAYFAHVVFARRDRGRWAQFAALTAAALLGPVYNLWWNSGHCWVNVLFNFFNRHEGAGFQWQNPPLYLLSLAYLATPWVLWSLWCERRNLREAITASATLRTAVWLSAVPLGLFLLMAFGRSVGLHWLLAFMPLIAVLAAGALPATTLQRLVRWSAAFALLHVLVAVVTLSLPVETWRKAGFYPGIVLTLRGDELAQALQEPLARCGEGCVLAMESYSSGATLSYAVQRPVAIFGEGSFHARQDDFDTDWRTLDGRDFLVLRKGDSDGADLAPFFRGLAVSTIELHGARFSLIAGQGFDYALYHERVLGRIRERFYRLPAWLPQRGCGYFERYFAETVDK